MKAKGCWMVLAVLGCAASLQAVILPGIKELLRHDGNGNGSLEAEEVNELRDEPRAAVLRAYDRNDDGAISKAELAKGPMKKGEAKPSKADKKKPANKKKNKPKKPAPK